MLPEMTDTFPEPPCTELTIPPTNSEKLPLKGDYVLTPEDLPSSSPLLIYTATVVPDSYIPDNQGGRESFVMARRLYNGVTNNKNVESKVIISAFENWIKKTSPYSRSDIEWTYVSSDFQPSSTTSNTRGLLPLEQPMRNPPRQLPIVNLHLRIQIKVFLRVEDEDDTLISDNDSIEPSHVQPQNTKPDTKGKRARTAKK
ncbi:7782_t:CDS:2 [Dentiscutata erythropus]|uniref:7782_t:CDS:1 n=1 Tax=Dentiscutata erythropus TaxID=1348616 RepID=A0A9N9GPR8_9GLOM|nr:7782_t:CDS:2 [Dentiscutata erythropus]